ncbi:hypothetical protein [Pantoea stewartii]|uniref:hypothetical protein n=1 Tax=Pantoea stewartii TaxID=66269 RepID=UPI0025A16F14|nr:hypothetical protein [Pantoea stewartii]
MAITMFSVGEIIRKTGGVIRGAMAAIMSVRKMVPPGFAVIERMLLIAVCSASLFRGAGRGCNAADFKINRGFDQAKASKRSPLPKALGVDVIRNGQLVAGR